MSEAGILSEDARVELIEGEIIEMTLIGVRHADCVNRLARILMRPAAEEYVVSIQNPLRLGDFSEPEPDLALLKQSERLYSQSRPGAEDVVLLIEVADTSLDYDRNVKLPLYARSGIPEVWLVDLTSNMVELHTDPETARDDYYATVRRFDRDSELESESVPGLVLAGHDIFG
jgi:Uma2 family endonuclease